MKYLLTGATLIFFLPIMIIITIMGDNTAPPSAANACVKDCHSIGSSIGKTSKAKTHTTSSRKVDQTITVDQSLAPSVQKLLNDAHKEGIVLQGWGWRLPEEQIRLRKQNCGTSNYATWHKKSSTCEPPTARPGHSQHEKGLAIDFTCEGQPLAGSECFNWLKQNAHKYGLYNLDSEPWHWSTTGR